MNLCCICAFAFLSAGAPALNTAASAEDQRGQALLRLAYDPRIVPLDNGTLNVVLSSTEFMRRGVESVVKQPAYPAHPNGAESRAGALVFLLRLEDGTQVELSLATYLPVDASRGGEPAWRTMLVDVEVRIAGGDGAAPQDVISGARQAVTSVLWDSVREEKKHREMARAMARQQLEEAQGRLMDVQGRMGAMQLASGRPMLSRQAVLTELYELQTQARSLEIDFVARQARRQRIEEQIARLAQQAAADPNMQIIECELQRILELRKSALTRLQKLVEASAASSSDIAAAETAASEAEVRLAQHRREAQRAAGGEFLNSLNVELTHLAAETAETEVRLAMLRKDIEEIKGKPLNMAEEYERLGAIELPVVTRALELGQQRVAEAEERLSDLREPTVTIVGSGAP
jgi:hypothetical protein